MDFISSAIESVIGHHSPPRRESKIISISILHRHGSRGPGESELGPWKTESRVRSQWSPTEIENLSTVGHKQCLVLGEWYAKYAEHYNLGEDPAKVFFRSSKSGRAKESAQDFVTGFNSARKIPINEKPVPYPNKEDPDNYFRPWKVIHAFSETLKKRMNNDELWVQKANENRELLERVFTKAGAEGVLTKLPKALWSTTYLHCIKECETFWPVAEGQRLLLTNLLSDDEWKEVTKLACWVWEERFVRSGFTVSMGGKLVYEILSRLVDPQYAVSIYSAHDYTILAVLSLLGLIPRIEGPANFSCYVLFELWDGPPPPHPSGSPRKSADFATSTTTLPDGNVKPADTRVVRVIFNPFPFDYHQSADELVVQAHNEKVLGEFSIEETQGILEICTTEFHLFSGHGGVHDDHSATTADENHETILGADSNHHK